MNAARSALLAHRNVTGLARSPANAGGTAFAFLGSTLTSSSTGALSGAMSVAIVSQVLEAIPALRHPRSLPPAHGWHARENPLSNPANTGDLTGDVLLQIPPRDHILRTGNSHAHAADVRRKDVSALTSARETHAPPQSILRGRRQNAIRKRDQCPESTSNL